MHSTDKRDYHVHKCGDCGYVWQHPNTCAYHHPSHICPSCGGEHDDNGIRLKRAEPEICFLGWHYPPGMKRPAVEPPIEPHPLDGLIKALSEMLGRYIATTMVEESKVRN